MCGRCMKTCPWNLEGLFAEKPFRWAAMKVPAAAPALARLDDAMGNGGLNPVKKWWWDIELYEDGGYHPARAPVNARGLQSDLKLRFEDQTLAVYPAPLAPPPWAYPFPMDREAGIKAYTAMVSAQEYKSKRAALETGAWDHVYSYAANSPVVQATIVAADVLTDRITKYTLQSADGADLPAWEAGAHVDVVIAPDMLRQYSLMGNPQDRSRYEIAILREEGGLGGSLLAQRIFTTGRRVTISKPINHFPLTAKATHSFLMGGGIGVTPMIAMAHALFDKGASFELHYSVTTDREAAFARTLSQMPWAAQVYTHVSGVGGRADFKTVLGKPAEGAHVYACGPDRYMQAVTDAAASQGIAPEAVHVEYFSVPETPEYENKPFTLVLRDGRHVSVAADISAAEALIEAGIAVDLKCSDGLCGVCKCGLRGGKVEHRDFVLSQKQRQSEIILCQSRAAEADGVIEIDL